MKKIFVFFLVLVGIGFKNYAQNTCAAPTAIGTLPYTSNNQTTCNRGADYGNGTPGCMLASHSNATDIVFRFTPSAAMCINISITGVSDGGMTSCPTGQVFPGSCPPICLNTTNGGGNCTCNNCGSTAPTNIGLYLLNGCPGTPNVSCLGTSQAGFGQAQANGLAIMNTFLTAGTTYYIILDVGKLYDNAVCANFNISVTQVTCPPNTPPPLPTAPQGVECGTNLGFESGNLTNWTGCHHDGTSGTCPVGQQFPGSCPAQCTSTTSSNGVCTCNGCSGAGVPPCCPLRCPIPGLRPANGTPANSGLGSCPLGIPAFPATAGNSHHVVTTGPGLDPNSDGQISVVAPGGRNFSVRIGNQEADYQSECLTQTFAVTKANALFTYLYAVVLQDPAGHADDERPRFEIKITDPGGASPSCGGTYTVISKNAAAEGFVNANNPPCGAGDVWYKKWTAVATDLTGYIGQNMTIRFCSADCGQGGHFGYAYVDTYCKPLEVTGTTVCTTGANVTLSAPPGFSGYSWYSGGQPVSGGVISMTYTVLVPGNVGGIFTVKMGSISSPGCFTYITDTVKIFTASASGDTTVCANSTGPVILKSTNSDPAGTTYNWSPATNLSCTNCPNPTVNPPYQTRTYTVTLTNAKGCTLSYPVTITVNNAIPITVAPATLCFGGTAALTANGPAVTYTWNTGAQTPGITVSPTITTSYTVNGTSSSGCTGSATVVVTVNPLPVITTIPATICAGASAMVSANGAVTYTWSTGATGPSITVTPAATTTYTVVGATAAGCTSTASVVVTVNPNPILTAAPVTICVGDNATLTAGGATTYTWSTGAQTPSISVSPLVTTTYTVVGATNGCTGSTTVVVTINNSITIPVPPVTICAGQSATLTAGGAAVSYTWSTGATTQSITVSPIVTTTYTVAGTSSSGCTGTGSVVVTVNPIPVITANSATICTGNCTNLTANGAGPGGTYAWTPSTGLSSITGPSVSACPAVSTNYTITGTTAAGCSSFVVTNVFVNPIPVVTVNSVTICAGQSATLTASGASVYTWSTGAQTAGITLSPVVTTSYTVVGATNSCTGTARATITVNQIPTITANSPTVCIGTPVTVTASGATSYTWIPGNTNGPSLSYTPTTNTTYTIIGSVAGGCTNSTTAVVMVNPIPIVNFEPDTAACAPLTVTFLNLSQAPIGSSSCLWTFTGGVPSSSNQCIPSPVTYSNPGTYSATLTVTSNGCSATLIRPNIINVYPYPKADFSASPQPVTLFIDNALIRFTDLSTGTPIKWNWVFERGGECDTGALASTIRDPTHTYCDTGTFKVCLRVENQYTCPDNICKYVIIGPEWTFYIPNAFSPNGDGKNEGFKGKSWNVVEHEMWIFDRWGNMIYYTGKTKDPESAVPWDGRANHGVDPAQEDVYVWVVKLTDIFGKKHKYIGHVTLVK